MMRFHRVMKCVVQGVLVICLGFSVSTLFAATQTGSPKSSSVRIVIVHSNLNTGASAGSLALWNSVANGLSLTSTTVQQVKTPEEAFTLLRNGQADVAVGDITYEPNHPRVYWINNYLPLTWKILLPKPGLDFWARISPYVRIFFGSAVGGVVFLIILFGLIVWWVERRNNPNQFPTAFWPGLGAGIWFIFTTMTGIGYGDKVPCTVAGRVVSSIWLILTLLAVSSFTAVIASELTTAKIATGEVHSLSELVHQSIGYMPGDLKALGIIERIPANPVPFDGLQRVQQALDDHEISAFIVKDLDLQYAESHDKSLHFRVAPFSIHKGTYVFVARKNFPETADIAQQLFELNVEGKIKYFSRQY